MTTKPSGDDRCDRRFKLTSVRCLHPLSLVISQLRKKDSRQPSSDWQNRSSYIMRSMKRKKLSPPPPAHSQSSDLSFADAWRRSDASTTALVTLLTPTYTSIFSALEKLWHDRGCQRGNVEAGTTPRQHKQEPVVLENFPTRRDRNDELNSLQMLNFFLIRKASPDLPMVFFVNFFS